MTKCGVYRFAVHRLSKALLEAWKLVGTPLADGLPAIQARDVAKEWEARAEGKREPSDSFVEVYTSLEDLLKEGVLSREDYKKVEEFQEWVKKVATFSLKERDLERFKKLAP